MLALVKNSISHELIRFDVRSEHHVKSDATILQSIDWIGSATLREVQGKGRGGGKSIFPPMPL